MIVLDALATVVGALVLAHGAWWLALSLLALPPLRQAQTNPGSANELRIVVVVPAHNEADLLPATLASLQRSATADSSILVVADNCSDHTADIARAAGVDVIERNDPSRRGKSYALDTALAALQDSSDPPDIVAFVDADCEVSPGFFEAIAAAFRLPDVHVVQAYYAPAGAASALGRLRRLAFALLHYSRPLGARRLGLPTTIKGTGMAMRWPLVSRGLGAEGLAEDAALTLSLARRGYVAEFIPSARVTGHMAQEYALAATQDHRWERGRLGLSRRALTIGLGAISRGQLRPAVAALEVASLPLSMLVFLAVVALGASLLGVGRLDMAVAAVGSLVLYVAAAATAARVSVADVLALATMPRFLVHKAGVYARALLGGQLDWTRTRR